MRMLVKSHVKTYQRQSASGKMVTVHEHEDARTKAQQHETTRDLKKPDDPTQDSIHDKDPLQTERPPVATVDPAKPGQLEAWLHQIEQEPDIQQAMRTVSDGTHTHHLYRQSDGTYDPERAKLHDSIVASMFNPRAEAESGKRPHAVILMGAPASGKTSSLQPAAKELGVEFTVINADDVKAKLPEYNGINAGLVHEESTDIVEGQLLSKAVDANHNIVLDITGGNAAKVKGLVEEFHKRGYEISVLYVHVQISTACARAVDRFRRTGRFVPPRYIAETVDGRPEETYNQLKQDPRVAHWRRYSNDGEQGQQTPLQEQGGAHAFGKAKGADSVGSRLQSLRGDGGDAHGQDAANPKRDSLHSPHLTPLHRAYQVRDALCKSIAILDWDLTSPDLGAAEYRVLATKRATHLHQLERLTTSITEAEALHA